MEGAGFNRHEQNVYFLPILVVDSGPPSLSSTGTLTIHVCGCDTGENSWRCRAITWHHCHCHRGCSRKGRFRRCLLCYCDKCKRCTKRQQALVFTFVSLACLPLKMWCKCDVSVFCHAEGAIQSCNATAYVMSAALSPGALIALLVCMLILIGKRADGVTYAYLRR